jgi:hypothetical protein
MKTIILSMFLLFTLTWTNTAVSQVSGEMTKYNIAHHGCEVDNITATWNLRTLMGEPVIGGNFKWEAPWGGDESCMSYNDFIIIQVRSNEQRDWWGWISISPGSTPRAGEGYPYNVSGSPQWNQLICGFDRDGNRENCMTSDDAKYFWQQGFSVVDFKLIRRIR